MLVLPLKNLLFLKFFACTIAFLQNSYGVKCSLLDRQQLVAWELTAPTALACVRPDRAPTTRINHQYQQYHQYLRLPPQGQLGIGPQLWPTSEPERVEHRHGAGTKPREVVTRVTSGPPGNRPGNSQKVCGGRPHSRVIMFERVATDGQGWRRAHPPPCACLPAAAKTTSCRTPMTVS